MCMRFLFRWIHKNERSAERNGVQSGEQFIDKKKEKTEKQLSVGWVFRYWLAWHLSYLVCFINQWSAKPMSRPKRNIFMVLLSGLA
ncbi:hypothetical protein JG559_05030 [Enterococcus faecalis]|uniref:Uncharacterized protein n=1 Tax=Enterococcus faecalis TaxID=1351 RepID=A0A974S6I7_ENTFL|nr:hypothetical protein JG559_05030 [Enterococcus faecalis]